MGYKYSEEEILSAAAAFALEEGLSTLTFGRLAKRIGIADRSIVYYFPTKVELLSRTAAVIGAQLQDVLEDAFGETPLESDDLIRKAWPILTTREADPIFKIFFEIVGLGSASIAPFDAIGPTLINAWAEWLVPRITDGSESAAYSILAILDGLLLLRHTCGPEAAEQAAEMMGLALG